MNGRFLLDQPMHVLLVHRLKHRLVEVLFVTDRFLRLPVDCVKQLLVVLLLAHCRLIVLHDGGNILTDLHFELREDVGFWSVRVDIALGSEEMLSGNGVSEGALAFLDQKLELLGLLLLVEETAVV